VAAAKRESASSSSAIRGQLVFPSNSHRPSAWFRHLRPRRPTIEVREQLYYPFEQAPRNPMAYVVRSHLDIAQLAPQSPADARRDRPRQSGC
jgi:hypothetical protein